MPQNVVAITPEMRSFFRLHESQVRKSQVRANSDGVPIKFAQVGNTTTNGSPAGIGNSAPPGLGSKLDLRV